MKEPDQGKSLSVSGNPVRNVGHRHLAKQDLIFGEGREQDAAVDLTAAQKRATGEPRQ